MNEEKLYGVRLGIYELDEEGHGRRVGEREIPIIAFDPIEAKSRASEVYLNQTLKPLGLDAGYGETWWLKPEGVREKGLYED